VADRFTLKQLDNSLSIFLRDKLTRAAIFGVTRNVVGTRSDRRRFPQLFVSFLKLHVFYFFLKILCQRKRTTDLLYSWYIELAISFLIGRKRTVNFRNQRLLRHYSTIIMSRTLKVTGNHVMYDRGDKIFLRVIMPRSLALCCLMSTVKKQILDFNFFPFNFQ